MKEYIEGLEELVEACKEEFKKGRSLYGDSWKVTDLEVHLNTVVNEALKLKHLRDKSLLKHRICDLMNYLIFSYCKA